MSKRRIAVLGAGPIGLEAALYAAHLGHDVQIYERGSIAQHIADWGFVRLFSPFRLNRSELGRRRLEEVGRKLPAEEAFLTGERFVMDYLLPLSDLPELSGRTHERTCVVSVGRSIHGKGMLLGDRRASSRFRLLLERDGVEREDWADVVFDCTGTYGQARHLGDGNLPALGERALGDKIRRRLEDIAGARRAEYSGKRVLLVGSGQSAATALDALLLLDDVSVDWVVRTECAAPYPRVADDPLPERDRLAELGNRLAAGVEPRVRYRPGTQLRSLAEQADGSIRVALNSGGEDETISVDRVLGLVGYRPDRSVYRNLQFHECYASEGPMKLAATLLGDDGGDCLAQTGSGPDSLLNPEPNFFVLGAKSYGTHSKFLIRIGIEQIRDAFTLVESNPRLNLYATQLVEEKSDV